MTIINTRHHYQPLPVIHPNSISNYRTKSHYPYNDKFLVLGFNIKLL